MQITSVGSKSMVKSSIQARFSAYSYGFRPGRNAHQAVLQAEAYLDEGKTRVIELDLDKFFDRANHD